MIYVPFTTQHNTTHAHQTRGSMFSAEILLFFPRPLLVCLSIQCKNTEHKIGNGLLQFQLHCWLLNIWTCVCTMNLGRKPIIITISKSWIGYKNIYKTHFEFKKQIRIGESNDSLNSQQWTVSIEGYKQFFLFLYVYVYLCFGLCRWFPADV